TAVVPRARYLTKRFWRQFPNVSCQADNSIADINASTAKPDPRKYRYLYFNNEYDLAKRFSPTTAQEDSTNGLPMRRSLSNLYFYPKTAAFSAPPIPPGTATFPYIIGPSTAAATGVPVLGRDENQPDLVDLPRFQGNVASIGDDLLLTDVISFAVQFYP